MKIALALLPLFLAAGRAAAFNLADHKRITRLAIAEMNSCSPGTIDAETANLIVAANLGEDVNLLRKWLRYSHYYNPNKRLIDLTRKDSSERVRGLQARMTERARRGELDTLEGVIELAEAIHHVQDMAVPPHVVPIEHAMDESFEAYRAEMESARSENEEIAAAACAQSAASEPLDVLRETALATLAAVHGSLEVLRDGRPFLATWDAYWLESPFDKFGGYGMFGDAFGRTSFDANVDGKLQHIEVSREIYDRFRERQIRLAVDATKKVLVWFEKEIAPPLNVPVGR